MGMEGTVDLFLLDDKAANYLTIFLRFPTESKVDDLKSLMRETMGRLETEEEEGRGGRAVGGTEEEEEEDETNLKLRSVL